MPMGGMELLIILVIILLFFGAKRVPELGRSLGKGMRELRKASAGADGDDDEAEDRKKKKQEEQPSLNEPARAEMPRAEDETIRPEHKP